MIRKPVAMEIELVAKEIFRRTFVLVLTLTLPPSRYSCHFRPSSLKAKEYDFTQHLSFFDDSLADGQP